MFFAKWTIVFGLHPFEDAIFVEVVVTASNLMVVLEWLKADDALFDIKKVIDF